MSANPDSPAPFQVSVPPTVYECEDATITWSGGNTVPLYEVYYAEGSGQTGDESALRDEKWLGSSSGNNFTWAIGPSWNTTIGDVIRFRVADNNGHGQNATAWSKVVAGNTECYASSAQLGPQSSFLVSIPQETETITTKSSIAAMSLPSTTEAAANPPQGGSNDNSGTPSPSEASSPAAAPTATGNPTYDPPSVGDSGSDNSNGPIEDDTQPGGQDSGNSRIETVVQDGTTFVFGGANPQATGSNQSVAPEVTAAQDSKDDSAHVNLPARAIGAIVGSLLGAIILWIIFMVWIRKRRNARKFHQMREVDEEESRTSSPGMRGTMKSLLTPVTHNPFNSKPRSSPPPLPTIMVEGSGRSLSPPSPALTGRESGTYSQFLTTPEAYTAIGDTFSALNSPDPFRRSFGAHPVPTVL